MIFALAGGKGGMAHFLDHLVPGIHAWWRTMDEIDPEITPDLARALIDGVADEAGARTIDDLEAERDQRLLALLKMLRDTPSAR